MNKCKYLTVRSKNYQKYFYCRLNKEMINYTNDCIKCLRNEPRRNKSINKTSKKKETVTKETYQKVVERDDYKCRLADITCNGGLELHHIKYRSEAKDLINESSNCIMLCNAHHRLVHSNKHLWQPILKNIIKSIDNN